MFKNAVQALLHGNEADTFSWFPHFFYEIYLGFLLFITTAIKKVFLHLKNHVIGHMTGAISVDGNSIASDWILTG